MTASIIPDETPLSRQLKDAAQGARLLLIAGLPSSGKSFVFQQLAILAHEAGRAVHTLQWDDARHAFETSEWLSVYPDPAPGTTHPAIRKAIGFWVRHGIARWVEQYRQPEDLLIVELPVVGGRFIELLRPSADAIEPFLAGAETVVLTPIPSDEVRQQLVEFRKSTSANPRNDGEAMEAPPSVVQASWREARSLFNRWTGREDDPVVDELYRAEVYTMVFERLNRHRKAQILAIDRVFETQGSTYDRPFPVTCFRPTDQEVVASYAEVAASLQGRDATRATDDWANY